MFITAGLITTPAADGFEMVLIYLRGKSNASSSIFKVNTFLLFYIIFINKCLKGKWANYGLVKYQRLFHKI